ncbi:MAG TPA: DUF6600 domain-containing protein [Steroidobacteraceae bacterium]|nr:DUF6600 domain-containing protein [Steroidobacteraceae bacterium]
MIILLCTLGVAVLSGTRVSAQQDADGQQAATDVDPPTRAARLSYVEGAVSVQPAGVDDWSAATINRPLTSGDQLWSDRGSRAEIEFGSATLSIAENTSVALLNLSDDAVQLQLSAGTINITQRDPDPAASFETDAPNASVSLARPGGYRIGVDAAGSTTVAIRNGQAQVITSAGQSVILRGGQGAQFAPSGDVDVATVGPADEFDRWCVQRQQRWPQNQDTTQYVSSDVVGAQELNNYGEWSQEQDYGYVWYPTAVAIDWAPYRYGRWLWVTPWGWTWVDSAPWGYAPFHYGRWAYLHERWGWVPAPPRSHAVYAPALVAWMGGPGPGPGVGWLPLAPGEVYLPGYRVSPRYLRNVNVSNTTILNTTYITNVYQNPALQNRYANRNAPRALTVVSQSSFTSGQPLPARIIAPPPQWQQANATPRPPGIVPARQSVLGPAGQTPVRRPPIAIANRVVVARHEPPPAPPSFDRQMDAMSANGGQALAPAQLLRLRGPDNLRPNVVLAPHVVPVMPAAPVTPTTPGTPATPTFHASPARPITPDRHVMPVTPAAPASPAQSAALPTPAVPPHAVPNDRRAIPERSPQFQAPVQIEREPLPQAAPPLPVVTPPPPPPPPQQPQPRQAPQAHAPDKVKGEPP